ncbi:MAG: radical SAM protein [Bacteroidales bacterium]
MGNSLGINLLPPNRKICTFDCIYCECGWTGEKASEGTEMPERKKVFEALEERLIQMQAQGNIPDSITFAGNGEPTIHPGFPGIVNDTLFLKNKYFPHAEVTVLSNASTIHKPEIIDSLKKVDNNILKLDAGTEESFRLINRPANKSLTLDSIVQNLRKFRQKVIIQTLFVRGEVDGIRIDNTAPEEVHAWINHIRFIRPRYVMLYPIDRQTPAPGLEVIPKDELYQIADQLRKNRIKYSVY